MNKTKAKSYLKHGLKEILLIVIGILIALQINNWNERRKDNNKVLKILQEMQKELVSDIEETNLLINWAEKIGKTSQKIINNEITDSIYLHPSSHRLFYIGTETYPLVVTDIAFNKLSDFDGTISNKYNDIIELSNQLYIEEKMYVEELFKRLNDYTLYYFNQMYKNHTWMGDLESKNITPEILDFFQNDAFYKNHIHRYKDLVYELGEQNTRQFKAKSIILFFEIEAITNSKSIPTSIKDYAPKDTASLVQYTGEFKHIESENTMFVTQKKGRLYAYNQLLYPIAKDTFKYANASENYIYFLRDEQNEITKSTIKWSDEVYYNEKVK